MSRCTYVLGRLLFGVSNDLLVVLRWKVHAELDETAEIKGFSFVSKMRLELFRQNRPQLATLPIMTPAFRQESVGKVEKPGEPVLPVFCITQHLDWQFAAEGAFPNLHVKFFVARWLEGILEALEERILEKIELVSLVIV